MAMSIFNSVNTTVALSERCIRQVLFVGTEGGARNKLSKENFYCIWCQIVEL